jgi:hypothetical protein
VGKAAPLLRGGFSVRTASSHPVSVARNAWLGLICRQRTIIRSRYSDNAIAVAGDVRMDRIRGERLLSQPLRRGNPVSVSGRRMSRICTLREYGERCQCECRRHIQAACPHRSCSLTTACGPMPQACFQEGDRAGEAEIPLRCRARGEGERGNMSEPRQVYRDRNPIAGLAWPRTDDSAAQVQDRGGPTRPSRWP